MAGREAEGGEPRPRRLTRSEAKARTRARLLESAAQVVARRGFAGASLEEIAESAGYSTGAVYANFENKEQLFMELVAARRTRGLARRVELLRQAVEEGGDADPLQALAAFFVEAAGREPETAPLQAEFWLYAVRNPSAMQVISASLAEQVEAVEPIVGRVLERAGASGAAATSDVATVVLALFQGLARRRRIDPSSVPDALMVHALRWVVDGLRAGLPGAEAGDGGGGGELR